MFAGQRGSDVARRQRADTFTPVTCSAMTIGVRQLVTVTAVAVGICVAGTACGTTTRYSSPAPSNAVTNPTAGATASAPSATVAPVPRVPVEVSGSGDTVQTVDLEAGGYTVQYTNSTGYMIVKPVNRDGSTGLSIINANDPSGVTTYASNGPVTFQIENAGQWSMRFVPLA